MALGDSYTIGEGVAYADRWPVRLAARLRAAKVEVRDPEFLAATGLTAAELGQRVREVAPVGPYDLASLLVGVNDQYRGLDAEAYGQEFRSLLATAIGLAREEPRRVLVLSIPDWGVTPFGEASRRAGVSEQIDRFNRVNGRESAAAGVWYVDITPLSREGARAEGALAADGLHPGPAMYAAWVGRVLATAWPGLAAPAGERT